MLVQGQELEWVACILRCQSPQSVFDFYFSLPLWHVSRNKGWIQVHYVILQASKCLINSFRYWRVRGLEMLTKQLCFPSHPQHTRTVARSVGIFIALSSPDPSFSIPSPAHTVITLAPPPPFSAFPGAIPVPGVCLRASGVWGEHGTWSTHTQSALFYYLRKAPASPLLQGENALSWQKRHLRKQSPYDNTLSLWWLRKATHPLRTKYLIWHSAFLQPSSGRGKKWGCWLSQM